MPISSAAVIGVWINNTPYHLTATSVIQLDLRWTFTADGSAAFRRESVMKLEGRPAMETTRDDHAGTWAIESGILVVSLPTRTIPRFEFTRIERRATDGEVRICLKSTRGGVYWRDELEQSSAETARRDADGVNRVAVDGE